MLNFSEIIEKISGEKLELHCFDGDLRDSFYCSFPSLKAYRIIRGKLSRLRRVYFLLDVFSYGIISFFRRHGREWLILESCNGVVVIDFRSQRTYKFVKPIEAEPQFIENERLAFASLPENVPTIYSFGVEGNIGFLVSQYISSNLRPRFRDWPKHLKEVTPLLFLHYKKTGIQKSDLSYIDELKKGFDICRTKQHFREEMNQIENFIFSNVSKTSKEFFKLFAHGDLVPNNILRQGENYYIFDWANGGWLNCFYDLMIQEFYFPDSIFWRNFWTNTREHFDRSEKNICFGIFRYYLRELESFTHHKFTASEIQDGFLISIAEIAIKNCLRYQFNSHEYKNGKGMLQNILKIFKSMGPL
jgi:hypothetical protein